MNQMTDRQFRVLADIARREAGLDFPDGKKAFLAARLQKRLRAVRLSSIDQYLELANSPGQDGIQERDDLVCALTTNVTSVWREPHHFQFLAEALDIAARSRSIGERPVQIWSAGCSIGAELLSIAATCRYVFGPSWASRVNLLGSDIDRNVLEDCRRTLETSSFRDLVENAPFPLDRNWKWDEALRKTVTLRRHNLLDDPPEPGRFHVVFCRNVTIYFDKDGRARTHRKLLDALLPEAFLFLGHSERLYDPLGRMTSIGRTAFRADQVKIG